jgi:coenzyme F420-reducing hydrogenase beta subunit
MVVGAAVAVAVGESDTQAATSVTVTTNKDVLKTTALRPSNPFNNSAVPEVA